MESPTFKPLKEHQAALGFLLFILCYRLNSVTGLQGMSLLQPELERVGSLEASASGTGRWFSPSCQS